jgi:hypothetical protein
LLNFGYCEIFFLFRLLEEGCNSDITFCIRGSNMKAHRFILAARSEYFQQIIDGKWKDKQNVSISNALVSYFRIVKNTSYFSLRATHKGLTLVVPTYCVLFVSQRTCYRL